MRTSNWLAAAPLSDHAYPPSEGPPRRRKPCRCGAATEQEGESSFSETLWLMGRIVAGERDANRLTDAVFWRRHPELQGTKLRADQRDLANEWLAILRDLVKPWLARATGSAAPPGPGTAPSGDVAAALRMSARPVPGLGITLRALVERHRSASAPELPLEVLIAFIYREAGNRTFDDATAGKWNESSQKYVPDFYELGLFQTPAGEHGCRQVNGQKVCAHPVPGSKVAESTFGKAWKRFTGRLPDASTWKDPEMQVRVGLYDLSSVGERISTEYPTLFTAKGSDWYVRMAVLYSFARGAGWTRAFLKAYGSQLGQLPEAQRWEFLRDKEASLPGRGRSGFRPDNVESKMSLAAGLRSAMGGQAS